MIRGKKLSRVEMMSYEELRAMLGSGSGTKSEIEYAEKTIFEGVNIKFVKESGLYKAFTTGKEVRKVVGDMIEKGKILKAGNRIARTNFVRFDHGVEYVDGECIMRFRMIEF